ncbi:hypothetical protein CC1G_06045 [Coprinopsis cinerea okayama7|uniref:Uncharacterized protein n=1 Tax=Coprinopsis cinerea (strain Okayama-7 / 130 / ATCC MYA-4618 / FGSC 9003) TaxID=240176 RepID=A8N4G8_COPC7|nr:hypothetical protein CC1G_06045 [Coprinopsis cinerea okayama7\|eukprot:XP_001829836.2 hypothetical protein CC1G_06045 [Coprinopsis cinerea okayama7\
MVTEIRDWLGAKVNFRAIHNDVKRKRTKGTGDWFINSPKYQEWKAEKGNVLCGTGIAGAGKTTLMSHVIDNLLHEESTDPKICVLFAYNRYDDLLSTADILKGLVLQAAQKQNERFLDAVKSTLSRCKQQGVKPTEDDLIGLLHQCEAIFDRVYYVFDGADELIRPDVKSEVLVELVKTINQLNGNIIISSRPLQVLQKLKHVKQVELKAQDDDMWILINDEIDWSSTLGELLEEAWCREDIVGAIIDNASGMFLHASLQVKALQGCPTLADVWEELDSFPKDITAMYEKTFRRIEDQPIRFATMAKLALLWLVHAKGQLGVKDLRAALAINPETFRVEEDRVPKLESIISACSGLVEYHEQTDVIRLIHFTARDALEPLLLQDYPQPHALITRVLLQLMIDNTIANCTVEDRVELEELLKRPLLRYAYQRWADHAKESGDQAGVRKDIANFLYQCSSFPYVAKGDSPGFDGEISDGPWSTFDLIQPLHVSVVYDLPWFIEEVLAGQDIQPPPYHQPPSGLPVCYGLDVNAQSTGGVTALHLAAHRGQRVCVDALLRFPTIDVNARSGRLGRTALMEAARAGDRDSVERLLRAPGINVNVMDNFGWTALMEAACLKDTINHFFSIPAWTGVDAGEERGCNDIVEPLLGVPGIEVDVVNWLGRTALMEAVRRGHRGTVERLFRVSGVEVPSVDRLGRTPLMLAAEGGNEDIFERFLNVPGVDVNDGDSLGTTVLMEAVARGRTGMVTRLLEMPGVNVNARDVHGRTALMLAAQRGDKWAVGRLLEVPGADIDTVDREGGSSVLKLADMDAWAAVWELSQKPYLSIRELNFLYGQRQGMAEREEVVRLLEDAQNHRSAVRAGAGNCDVASVGSGWETLDSDMWVATSISADCELSASSTSPL